MDQPGIGFESTFMIRCDWFAGQRPRTTRTRHHRTLQKREESPKYKVRILSNYHACVFYLQVTEKTMYSVPVEDQDSSHRGSPMGPVKQTKQAGKGIIFG